MFRSTRNIDVDIPIAFFLVKLYVLLHLNPNTTFSDLDFSKNVFCFVYSDYRFPLIFGLYSIIIVKCSANPPAIFSHSVITTVYDSLALLQQSSLQLVHRIVLIMLIEIIYYSRYNTRI